MDMVTGHGLVKASVPTERKATRPPMALIERMLLLMMMMGEVDLLA